MRAFVGGLLFFSAVTFVSHGAAAQTAPPVVLRAAPDLAAKPTAEESRLSAELVDLIHPDQLMFESNMRGWEAVTRKTASVDPLFSKLEAEYPGVIDAAIESARPAAGEYARDFVRKAKAAKSEVVARCLDEAELRQLIDFFRQPVGQRFALSMSENTDSNDVAEQVAAKLESGETTSVTPQELQGVLRKQARSAFEEMSADDLLEIAKFESLPVAKKFAAAGQEADLVILEIINNPDPELLRKQHDAAIQGAVKFVEAKKASAR